MSELASGLGAEADNFRELGRRFDAAHPRAEPHYYLSLLGTHPDHRGKGLRDATARGEPRDDRRGTFRRIP